jgi:hypothetical protein
MTFTRTTISDINRRTGEPGWLNADAAAAYERMKRDGMPGDSLSDAGRTYAEQKELYEAYLRGELEATAARPGESLHEVGDAIDIKDPARSWVRARPEYGFVKDTVANEPWHMVYRASTDQHLDDQEDDDMGNLDPKQKIPVTGEAAKALGSDEITLGGFVGLAAADYRQNRRDNAKLLTEVQALRRSLGQPVDEKELAERVVEQITDDLQDAVKEALAGTNVDPDFIAKKTADVLAKRLAS